MTFVLKNTFIDLVQAENDSPAGARRSSSTPPAWKPHNPCFDDCDGNSDDTPLSDASTRSNRSAKKPYLFQDDFYGNGDTTPPSDDSTQSVNSTAESDTESIPNTTNDFDSESLAEDPFPAPPKQTLCLDATISSSVRPKTKLSSKARAFVSEVAVPDEIHDLIEQMREVLQSCPDVLNTRVSEGAMGGTTTMLAEVRNSSEGVECIKMTIAAMKATALNVAADSQSTYVIGYKAQPFKEHADCPEAGFKFKVSSITPLQEQSMCWDYYELGHCPYRDTCQWCHPVAKDLMTIVVMFMEKESS